MCQQVAHDDNEQDVPWLSPIESRAWRGLRRIDPVVLGAIGRDLHAEAELSEADYDVLTALSETDGRRLPFRELEQRTGWSSSRLSHQVRRMAERGLVERADDPDDGRSSVVALTDDGWRAIADAAPDHVRSVRRHLFDALTREQTQQLAAIAERLLAHHGTGIDGPAGR